MRKALIAAVFIISGFTLTKVYAAVSLNSCYVDNTNDMVNGKPSLTKWSWYCWNKQNGTQSRPNSKATYIGFQCPEANTTQCGPNTPGSVELDLNGSQPGNFLENVDMPFRGDGLDVYTNNLPLGQCGRVQTDWIEFPAGVIAGGVVRAGPSDCYRCAAYKTIELSPKNSKDMLVFNKAIKNRSVTLSNVDINAPVKVTSWWGWTGGENQREGEVNEQKNETNTTTIKVVTTSGGILNTTSLGCIDLGNLPHIQDGFGGAMSPFAGGHYFQCGNNNPEGLSRLIDAPSSTFKLQFETRFTGLDGITYTGAIPPIKLRGSHYNKIVVNYCSK